MDVRFAGTERPASWLVPEIVPQLNSPTAKRTGVMGLPLPLATGLSWVGPPSNLGGVCARYVLQSMSVLCLGSSYFLTSKFQNSL